MNIKAAVHIHSEWSYDGTWSLKKIKSVFERLGYNAILMSEHDTTFDDARWVQYRRACAEESSEKILIVPGIEYSDASNTVHILAWGDIPFLGREKNTMKILESIKQHDGVAVFAHPSRREAWRLYNNSWEEYLTGIELWNRKMDGLASSPHAYNILSRPGNSLFGFTGLDFHQYNQLYPLTVNIDAADLEEALVLRAAKNKECVATCCGIPINKLSKGACGSALKQVERIRKIFKRIIATRHRP